VHKKAISHNGQWGKEEAKARKTLLLLRNYDLIVYNALGILVIGGER